jgi:hypothetical protein
MPTTACGPGISAAAIAVGAAIRVNSVMLSSGRKRERRAIMWSRPETTLLRSEELEWLDQIEALLSTDHGDIE